jgi:hypothetical protein
MLKSSIPSEEDIVGRIQFHRPDVDVMSLFNSSLKSGQNKLERWFLAHLMFAGKARSLPPTWSTHVGSRLTFKKD